MWMCACQFYLWSPHVGVWGGGYPGQFLTTLCALRFPKIITSYITHHPPYSDVKWVSWYLKSRVIWLCVQLCVQANIKENIKTPHHWHVVRRIHHWWLTQRASNEESISISWHHALSAILTNGVGLSAILTNGVGYKDLYLKSLAFSVHQNVWVL